MRRFTVPKMSMDTSEKILLVLAAVLFVLVCIMLVYTIVKAEELGVKLGLAAYHIAFVGSRRWERADLIAEWMEAMQSKHGNDLVIVSGGADGADKIAALAAHTLRIRLVVFKPDWNRYGKAAGPIRNTQIVERSKEVIAFWMPNSRGTKDTIKKAWQAGKRVRILDSFGKRIAPSSVM